MSQHRALLIRQDRIFPGSPPPLPWTAATPPSRPHPAPAKRATVAAGGPSTRHPAACVLAVRGPVLVLACDSQNRALVRRVKGHFVPMLHGYIRCSTTEQNPRLQIDAMQRAGITRIWLEQRSAVAHRPELERMLYSLRAGDRVMVWKLDRLARSLSDLLSIYARIERAGASVGSLTEPIDTSTPMGRMMFQMLGTFAEFERAMIRERAAAGREAARARGVKFGRPRTVDLDRVLELHRQGMTHTQIAHTLGCDRSYAGKLVRRALGES